MNDIKILIGEDDVLIAEHLKSILLKLGFHEIVLGHNKKSILSLIERNEPHIALLDINMDSKYTGIEIGEYIQTNFGFPVIYITAYAEINTIERALKTRPAGYILKPFNSPEIYSSIRIALQGRIQDKFIIFKDGYVEVKLDINQILYIQADDNYLDIISKHKKYSIRHTLFEIMKELDEHIFFRVHKSFIVNINYVSELSSNSVLLRNTKIPVSRSFYKDFKNAFMNMN